MYNRTRIVVSNEPVCGGVQLLLNNNINNNNRNNYYLGGESSSSRFKKNPTNAWCFGTRDNGEMQKCIHVLRVNCVVLFFDF